MKGVARTIVQLIYGNGLQRWLARIGLGVTILGFGALQTGRYPSAQPGFSAVGSLAAAIAVISPVVVGAFMFRALAAPRAIELIPHGRLQLVLGAFGTQLLLALFIAITVFMPLRAGAGSHASVLGATSAGGLIGVLFAYAFIGLTFLFFNFYWIAQSRLAAFTWLVYLLVPPLLSQAFPQLHLWAQLGTPAGLLTLLTVSLMAWPAFGLSFIRRGQINIIPEWKLVGAGSTRLQRVSAAARNPRAPRHYSRQQASRILLTGRVQRLIPLLVLILSVAFLAAMLITTRINVAGKTAFVWAFVICVFAGVAPTIPTGLMTQRARSLWLTAGMDREQLFIAIERQSWRQLLWVAGAAMALAVPLLSLSVHAVPGPAELLSILAVPLTLGASMIYVGLLVVRGRRRADTLLWASYSVLLMIEIFSALARSSSSILPSLLGANIIALPLLRHIARRRWQNIDWLIHKRSAAQFTG